jgi:hypothetical protein
MEQYIPKSAVVAEIEKLEKLYCYGKSDGMLIAKSVFDSIKNIINTFEVKEVDLEREQRMKECPYRRVECTMYDDSIFECKGACNWVVDYLKLKELKA